MKNLTHFTALACSFFIFLFSFGSINAQSWGNFDEVISQLDSAKRAEYLQNLQQLDTASSGTYNFNGVFLGLNVYLQGNYNPSPNNLNTLVPSDTLVRDSFLSTLNFSDYTGLDSLSAITQVDSLTNVWSHYQDSLRNLYNTQNDALQPLSGLPNQTRGFLPQWSGNVDSLRNNQMQAFGEVPVDSTSALSDLFDSLFDPNSFPTIELLAGSLRSVTSYYDLEEVVSAPMIGLRSSFQMDRLWEPRWRVEASWFKNNAVNTGESITQQNSGYNPFIFNGSFDVMYNPVLGLNVAGAPLRLITLLGIEGGTYAPSHKDYLPVRTANNKGFTTGWGPVVGAGFALKAGNASMFALGTTAYGDVITNPNAVLTGYKYRSTRLEAGVRYGTLISIYYQQVLSMNWATEANKYVRYHQVCVGLPLSGGLFR